jgi:hypothetical protein
MKIYKILTMLMAATALLLTSAIPANAGRRQVIVSEGAGRLIIWRSPALGRNVIVGLSVDGRHVADLTYGRHYDEPISSGPHTITAQPYPRVYAGSAYRLEINVRPGQLYNFTAKGGATQLVLK